MRKVYQGYHSYDDSNDCQHSRLVGHFSSKALAEEAVIRLKDRPGFRDHPEGFYVGEAMIDVIMWQEGFVRADKFAD